MQLPVRKERHGYSLLYHLVDIEASDLFRYLRVLTFRFGLAACLEKLACHYYLVHRSVSKWVTHDITSVSYWVLTVHYLRQRQQLALLFVSRRWRSSSVQWMHLTGWYPRPQPPLTPLRSRKVSGLLVRWSIGITSMAASALQLAQSICQLTRSLLFLV